MVRNILRLKFIQFCLKNIRDGGFIYLMMDLLIKQLK